MGRPVIAYVNNADWYFKLHWMDRALAVQAEGAEVHVITDLSDGSNREFFESHGFVFHHWKVSRRSINPLVCLLEMWRLFLILRAIGPDLIHAITVKPNIYYGLLSRFMGIPYVMSITGLGLFFSGRSLYIRLLKPLFILLYKLIRNRRVMRRVIFENSEDRELFLRKGLCEDHDSVLVLGAGVDTDLFACHPEPEPERPVILYAARLLWDKGLGELVEAGRILRERGHAFTLQVAGIPDEESINHIPMRLVEKWHREGSIDWLGRVEAMPELISKANMVVLPSYYGEGVPRILIEAASAGRAVVTTDQPGCREIARQGDNGLLVPPRDARALADAIGRLIGDASLRRAMGRRGREIAVADFSSAQVISDTLALYACFPEFSGEMGRAEPWPTAAPALPGMDPAPAL